MITFACKKINREDLLRCSFNLNKTEYKVFMFLLSKHGKYKVKDISSIMGLERTGIQKALKGLLKKNLIKRSQKNLERGGYVYLYTVKDKKEIKQRMREIIDRWYQLVIEDIEKL